MYSVEGRRGCAQLKTLLATGKAHGESSEAVAATAHEMLCKHTVECLQLEGSFRLNDSFCGSRRESVHLAIT